MFAARLPAYTKNTRRLDPAFAVNVREALLKAKDPYTLITTDLPQAVGLTATEAWQTGPFVARLKDAIAALQRAYPALLDDVEAQARQTFDLHGASASARDQLRVKALPLEGLTAERGLAQLVREAGRFGPQADWRETLGRVVGNGNPPHQWRDPDVVNFQVKLVQLAHDFARLTELAAEKHRTGASQVLRIGILNGQARELREIIAVPSEHAEVVNQLVVRILNAVDYGKKPLSYVTRRTILAALTTVAAQILEANEAYA